MCRKRGHLSAAAMLACATICMRDHTHAVSLAEFPAAAPGASARTTAIVLVFVACAVMLRSFVYLLFEQLAFDSDQAINGLMAKHLIEGRAFPLFFYGQTYLLAVEAWAAAPFFVVAGPTVVALRLSLLAWNIAFAYLLIMTLHRHNGLHLWLAVVPALIFLVAPPSVAAQLMNAQGAIVEPYVYVAALWLLRGRPLSFGALLAIGFRNREFVAYAIPAILAVEFLSGDLDRMRWLDWLRAAVAFAVIWQIIEALKPLADLMGPGTRGQLVGGFSGSQITNLAARFDFAFAALPERAARLGPQILHWLSGARQVNSSFPLPDRPWIAMVVFVYMALVSGRLALLVLRPTGAANAGLWRTLVAARIARANFAFYLMAVGATATVVFIAGRPVLSGYSRYVLLGLICPIGLIAALLTLEPIPHVRRLAAGVVIVWALISAVDHASITASYIRHPEIDAHRMVADQLLAAGTPVAAAGYWHAYVITFLARERVRVASQDFVRIQEYQDEFLDRIDQAVAISDEPCPGGRLVGVLYICKP